MEEETTQEETAPEEEAFDFTDSDAYPDADMDEDEEDTEEEDSSASDTDEDEAPGATTQVPVVFPGESAAETRLREVLDPDVHAALTAAWDARLARVMQVQGVARSHVTQAAAANPELFRVYGAKIEHNLSQFPQETQASAEGVNLAMAGVLIEEARTHGLGRALGRLASLANGTPEKARVEPKKAIPKEQRPPSPTNNPRQVTVKAMTSDEKRVALLMKSYGVNKSQARLMLTDEQVMS